MVMLLASASAQAGWMKFGTSDEGDVHYVDVDTLKRSGPRRVQIWARIELPKPTYGMESRSVRLLVEHDCLLRKQRVLQVTYYTRPNLTGHADPRGRGAWVDVGLNTMGSDLHNAVCQFK